MSKTYTVKRGHIYKAFLRLSGLEAWASNEYIHREFNKVGFRDVRVTGSGALRYAAGRWPKADATARMPVQVVSVRDVTPDELDVTP